MKRIFFIISLFVACAISAQAQTVSDISSLPTTLMMPDSLCTPVKVPGYRIQVYSGGNSREAKREANAMGYKVQFSFPELSVYTRFVSPRWLCRVGDFLTRAEASEKLQEMREAMGKQLTYATIVKCKVSVPAYRLHESSATDSVAPTTPIVKE